MERIIKGRFYIPKIGKYKFFNLKIAPSTIKEAGLGCFAIDPIPKGAKGKYRGIFKSKNSKNFDALYSWSIYKYDTKGNTKYKTLIGYLDGSNIRYSNWSRFVNCGKKNKHN